MPINFPPGAVNGQKYTYLSNTWVYNSTTGAWSLVIQQEPSAFLTMGA